MNPAYPPDRRRTHGPQQEATRFHRKSLKLASVKSQPEIWVKSSTRINL